MIKKVLAIILALCMVLSLCACRNDDVEVKEPDDGYVAPSDDPISSDEPILPACMHDVSVALENSGYTFDGENVEDIPNETGFIHPIEQYYVIEVGNGETLYFSDFGTEEKAAEHAACYDSTGSHYENMIIDYAMPVHFWQAGNFIIEYGSETGELMYILNDIFGEEFAGAGADFYKPAYAKELGEKLSGNGYDAKFIKVLDSGVIAEDVSNVILNGVDNIYLYKYSTEELLLKHQGSPVDAPVLNVPTVWTDLDNLVAIEYGGSDEKVISLLNSVYPAELKEIPVHSIVYYRNGYDEDYDKNIIEIIESVDEMYAYYEENMYNYDLLGDPFNASWIEACSDYTAEWFEGNVLVMVKLIEGSGSISHEVTSVKKSGNNISISIKRNTPEIGTCDMAGWHIMMGISRADYAGCTVSLDIPEIADREIEPINAQAIRTDIIDWDSSYDEIVIIDSFDKLESYYEKNKDMFDLEHKEKVYADTTIGFVDTFETYNEEWFENNVLLMAVVEEGSGSIRHSLCNVIKTANGDILINYERIIPELCTDDMACWHIMVGVSKEYYNDLTCIFANGENVYEYAEIIYADVVVEKPVIYFYPEDVTEVSVKLTVDGELTCTYPKYDNGWQVTAMPDGTLIDKDGQTYSYLYWEALTDAEYDFSKGFCIKGEDTAEFLEDALEKLGLNRREANEFIIYWLPRMEQNEYNIISFQTDVYTESAKLEISPVPDTLIRVFMAYKPAEKPVEIEAQELDAPERTGFTVVEWGGAEIDSASP